MELLPRFSPMNIFVLWVSVLTSIRTVCCLPIAAQFRRAPAAATNNVQYYYYFDEEKGFFKGKEICNSVRMFNRTPAVLKRRSCSPPPRWLVEKFKDIVNAENEETNDTDIMINHKRNVKHQSKRFFSLPSIFPPIPKCEDETITATIRDERPLHFQQFPLVVTYNSSKLTRIRVHTSDVFSEEQHPANKEIVWQIKNPTRSLVNIHFNRFDMPEQPNCQDYVSLHNSDGNIFKICRKDQLQARKNIIQLQGVKITIKFVTSDLAGAGTGFSADVTILR